MRVTLTGHLKNLASEYNGTARELWLELERKYKPKGFVDGRNFWLDFQSTRYDGFEDVYKFQQALYKPVYLLKLMGEEFGIPEWIYENRFIDCIHVVHGPILSDYLSRMEGRLGSPDRKHDPLGQIQRLCEIVEAHETELKRAQEAYKGAATHPLAKGRRSKKRRQRQIARSRNLSTL